MKEWNQESISQSFERAANDANRYLCEIRNKAKNNLTYQFLYDEHLAKFWLYNSLWGKLFLSSRDTFIKELKFRAVPAPELIAQGYDSERIKNFYESFINNLLEQYS